MTFSLLFTLSQSPTRFHPSNFFFTPHSHLTIFPFFSEQSLPPPPPSSLVPSPCPPLPSSLLTFFKHCYACHHYRESFSSTMFMSSPRHHRRRLRLSHKLQSGWLVARSVVKELCWKKFGWENSKADELLLPVLKEYNKHEKLNLLRGGRVSELGEVTLKIWGFCFGVVGEKNAYLDELSNENKFQVSKGFLLLRVNEDNEERKLKFVCYSVMLPSLHPLMENLKKSVIKIAYSRDHVDLSHLHRSFIPFLYMASSLYKLALSLRHRFYLYGILRKHRGMIEWQFGDMIELLEL
ncbi:putative tetraacyldisaccharide 4'-kinase [Cucumis melo var. makuwa]|uniref:Tetraacyldisaccharide 4'-kinase n=1 Tax=Cucumis melo var. makuwa TaxID=1194695 RepID=A0A5A7TMV1_CUCMM|nr:putative tetraacyldisaccharide 4'-kinase [Cucumis melo var. makuwa]